MSSLFKIPKWVAKHNYRFNSFSEIPKYELKTLREKYAKRQSNYPYVSLIVIAYNEEANLIRCLSSLADQQTLLPMEVVVVDNNSQDRTLDLIKAVGVRSIFQPRQGVGHARSAGMFAAKGRFHLTCDADTIYPPNYVDEMLVELERRDTAGVFGSYSFLNDGKKSRFGLAIYEFFRDMVVKLRSINRPELSAGGASLGYRPDFAKDIGWRTDIKRGEDGAMIHSLKEYGTIRRVKSRSARPWTSSRTLDADGSFLKMILKRIDRELLRLEEYFTKKQGSYELKPENRL